MSIGSIAKTGFSYAGKLIFDDRFASKVTSSLKAIRKSGKVTGLHRQIGTAFQQADKYVIRSTKGPYSCFGAVKNSLRSYCSETGALWKSSKGIFSKLGGTFKGLLKRAPLIGTALTVAFEIPNIYRATRDGGLVNGVVEAGKSGVRLAAGIGLGAVGAAFLGPVGAIAGFMLGDWVGKLVVGKSHTEKLAEQEEKQQELISQYTGGGYDPAVQGGYNQGGTQYAQPPTFTSFLPQSTMTQDQLMAYGNALYGGGMNNFLTQGAYNQGLTQPRLNYFG